MNQPKKYVSAFAQETKDNGTGQNRAFSFEERAAFIKQELSQNNQKFVNKNNRGELLGLSADLARELPNIVEKTNALRQGTQDRAALDITVGQYVESRYGVKAGEFGQMDGFLKLLGVDKRNATLAQLANQTVVKFTTMPELNKNYEWLIGETITEAVRAGMLDRALFQNLITGMETVPFDSIKIPVVKNAGGSFHELREGETFQVGTMEFDEIAVETKDAAAGFKLNDRVIRNMRINILQEYLQSKTGKVLNAQLTNEAVDRLINGNNPAYSDAAPIVGVASTGAFDYDTDWLRLVVAASQNGYSFNTVVGVRDMIIEAMALPEFKGFDGNTVKAEFTMDIPMPADYSFYATGAMPAKGAGGGQLLFLDPSMAMTHYTTKPLQLESQRLIRTLTNEYVVSLTSCFVKKYADAAMILDSSVAYATNPFPAEFDMEVWERALGGFTVGIGH